MAFCARLERLLFDLVFLAFSTGIPLFLGAMVIAVFRNS